MDSKMLFEKWGFRDNPFRLYTAEHEEDLPRFFVKPPYFRDIIGDTNSPKSSIIFGHRGEGKSAIFKMIKYELQKSNSDKPLIVTYTNFSYWNENDINNISLENHIERILGLTVNAFINELESAHWRLGSLNANDKNVLQWFALRFLPYAEDHQAENRLNSLFDNLDRGNCIMLKCRWLFRRVKSFLRRKRIEIENVSDSESSAAQIIKIIMIFISPQHPGSLPRETMLNLLIRFKDLVLCAGFSSIYILVDKVDEPDVCSGRYDLAARLIKPIVTSISFLELDKIAIKLFLPIQIEEELGVLIRTDRVVTRQHISWSDESLKIMLNGRLLAYSDDKIETLKEFVEPAIWDEFNKKLLYYSAMCPRNLIRLLDLIIAELCEIEDNPIKITKAAMNEGQKHFLAVRLAEGDYKAYQKRLSDNIRSIEGIG
jgi:hypothetical protein